MTEHSYNGWVASRNPNDFGGLTKLIVGTESFSPGVRSGDVHTVLSYVATQLNERVEPVQFPGGHDADDWGYNYRANVNNPSQLSCHASGTAFDYNATRHPNGKRGTFSSPQMIQIAHIIQEVGGVVRWGGDFAGTRDEMHFEICSGEVAVAKVAARLRAVPAPSVGSARPTIKKGATGDAVKLLQSTLNKNYPAYSKLVVDGDFGDGTDGVVREFQKRAKLTVDGVVGAKTWGALGL